MVAELCPELVGFGLGRGVHAQHHAVRFEVNLALAQLLQQSASPHMMNLERPSWGSRRSPDLASVASVASVRPGSLPTLPTLPTLFSRSSRRITRSLPRCLNLARSAEERSASALTLWLSSLGLAGSGSQSASSSLR